MALTIPNESAAPADGAQATLYQADVDAIVAGVGGDGVLYGCAVTAQGSPDNTVAVAAGAALVGNAYAAVAAGNVTMPSADGTHPMWVLISVSSAGTKTATAGTAAAAPLLPAIPANHVALAAVWWPASDTTVASSQITDKRAILPPLHGWEPWGYGLRAWAYDVAAAYDTSAPASGEINLIKVWNPIAQSVEYIDIIVRTAGSGLTSSQNYAGIYDMTGARLGQTADQTTAWGSNGHKHMAISGGAITLPAGWCYVAILSNGTTRPALSRGIATAAANLGLGSGALRWATISSGQTSLPSSLTLSGMSAHGLTYWAGLS